MMNAPSPSPTPAAPVRSVAPVHVGPPPRVSIVTAAFNAAATIEDTIASVRAQTLQDWELIVVDDGSSDDTLARVQAWSAQDPRIRVFAKANGGASSARNFGLAHARGGWLHFLDADDLLKPDGLAALLAGGERAEIVIGAHERVTETGAPAGLRAAPKFADPAAELARGCPIVPAAALVRTDLARRLSGFDASLTVCEDWDFWRRAASAGARFAAIESVAAAYRLRPGSLSRRADRVALDGAAVIRRAYEAGDPFGEGADAQAHFLVFAACTAAAGGADSAPMLAAIAQPHGWAFDPAPWGGVLCDAIAYALAIDRAGLTAHRELASARIDALVDALEARIGACRQTRLLRTFARLDLLGADAPNAEAPDLVVVDLDAARPLRAIAAGAGDVVVARVFARQRYLGWIDGVAEDFATIDAIRARLHRATPRLAGRAAFAGLAGPRLLAAASIEAAAPAVWRAGLEQGPAAAARLWARRAAARALSGRAPASDRAVAIALARDCALTPDALAAHAGALRACGFEIIPIAEMSDRACARVALGADGAALGADHPILAALPRGAAVLAPAGANGASLRRRAQELGLTPVARIDAAAALARRPLAEARAFLAAARAEIDAPVAGIAFAPGGADEVTRRLARHAGFAFGVNPEPGLASGAQDPMNWRRIELRPTLSPEALAGTLGAFT